MRVIHFMDLYIDLDSISVIEDVEVHWITSEYAIVKCGVLLKLHEKPLILHERIDGLAVDKRSYLLPGIQPTVENAQVAETARVVFQNKIKELVDAWKGVTDAET